MHSDKQSFGSALIGLSVIGIGLGITYLVWRLRQ